MENFKFDSIESALEDFKNGKLEYENYSKGQNYSE
jgi:hypothetical protein